MGRIFDFFERKLSWHYLNGTWGAGLFRTLADACDATFASSKDAVRQRLLSKCTDEALPYLGQNFNLDWPARFTAQQIRDYIGSPWDHWENAGSAPRLVAELTALGHNPSVISYRSLVDIIGTDPNTTFGGYSSFFYVILRAPFPFPWDVAGRWGPPPVGSGALWGSAPFLWGISGAQVWQLDEVRRTIAKWKPAGSSCRFIEVWLKVDIFGVPTEVRRFPVHEQWELQSNGAAREFYNYSYSQERV